MQLRPHRRVQSVRTEQHVRLDGFDPASGLVADSHRHVGGRLFERCERRAGPDRIRAKA
jgi:hypothetical protein